MKSNDVQAVTVDGVNISYTLRPNSTRFKALQLPDGTENLRISYSTVRPADLSTPYDTMLHNKIQFQAVDKRNNRFTSILVIPAATLVSRCTSYTTLSFSPPDHGCVASNVGDFLLGCFWNCLTCTRISRDIAMWTSQLSSSGSIGVVLHTALNVIDQPLTCIPPHPFHYHLKLSSLTSIWSLQMYALYIGLVLSFLNRFPIKMPQRGSARRFRDSVPNTVVTFKDVAGVDEAKEELSEVVV